MVNVWELIQERYDKNNENGIPLNDFLDRYGKEVLDNFQSYVNNGDIKWLWAYGKDLSSRFDSMDDHHHINNILQLLMCKIDDMFKS